MLLTLILEEQLLLLQSLPLVNLLHQLQALAALALHQVIFYHTIRLLSIANTGCLKSVMLKILQSNMLEIQQGHQAALLHLALEHHRSQRPHLAWASLLQHQALVKQPLRQPQVLLHLALLRHSLQLQVPPVLALDKHNQQPQVLLHLPQVNPRQPALDLGLGSSRHQHPQQTRRLPLARRNQLPLPQALAWLQPNLLQVNLPKPCAFIQDFCQCS